jgi:hypothetical protein
MACHPQTAYPVTGVNFGGLCQLSRHEGEAGEVGRSDLVYAAAIISINWATRSR